MKLKVVLEKGENGFIVATVPASRVAGARAKLNKRRSKILKRQSLYI